MKHLLYLFFLMCLLGLASQIYAKNGPAIDFADSYLSGREISEVEGKPLLVYFYESDNAACQKMESVWKNEKVIATINNNYICSRVNINHFDGKTLKKYHKIETAPAFIILKPSGEVVRRLNTALTSVEFVAFLNGDASFDEEPTQNAKKEDDKIAKDDTQEDAPQPTATETKSTASILNGEFTIQLGVFSTKENAMTKAADLKRIFNEPIHIARDQATSKTIYRVVIGEFPDRPTADSFLQLVRQYNIKGFVKSLPL